MAEKLTFVCSKFCRKIENVQISKKHHNYRTAGGVSRQTVTAYYPAVSLSRLFPPQILPPQPLLRPGPHLTAACLAAVQISVIYLQNIFIIDARTMLQTARFSVCIEYFYIQSNAVRTLCYIQ